MPKYQRDEESKLKKFKDNVEEFHGFFKDNSKRFKESMRFAFKETLSDSDKRKLRNLDKPILEVNYIQAYLSRLLGEFSKQTPECKVTGVPSSIDGAGNPIYSQNQLQLNEYIESILREIFYQYNKRGDKNQVLKEQCGGGYSVLRVKTKYRNNDTFDQDIVLTKARDPTLCFFDPMAKRLSKSDGKYCGEVCPMTIEEFNKKFPGYSKDIEEMNSRHEGGCSSQWRLQWKYKNATKDIVLVVDYYSVESRQRRSLLLADGTTKLEVDYNKEKKESGSPDLMPAVVKRRMIKEKFVKRYVFCGNEILEEEEMPFKRLPYIFVDGNSAFAYKDSDSSEIEQVTNSYIWNAMGAQKMLNHTCQTMANFSENWMAQKMIADVRAIEDSESWTNPQTASVLLKKSIDDNGLAVPEPVIFVNQQDLPGSVMNTFASMQNVMQNTFGSYDAMLGINQKDLSGIAIQEGATQNNAVAMPFINGYLDAINAATELIVGMIPLINVTPSTIPIMDEEGNRSYIRVNDILPDGSPDPNSIQLSYGENDLNVEVSAGYSFEIQKDKSLKMLSDLMGVFPQMAQTIDTYGQEVILDQLNIRGVDKLKDIVKKAQEERRAQQSQGQPDPRLIQQKQEYDLKIKQLQLSQAELSLKEKDIEIKREIEMLKLAESRTRANAEIQNSAIDAQVKMSDHLLRKDDQEHKQTIDVMKVHR